MLSIDDGVNDSWETFAHTFGPVSEQKEARSRLQVDSLVSKDHSLSTDQSFIFLRRLLVISYHIVRLKRHQSARSIESSVFEHRYSFLRFGIH